MFGLKKTEKKKVVFLSSVFVILLTFSGCTNTNNVAETALEEPVHYEIEVISDMESEIGEADIGVSPEESENSEPISIDVKEAEEKALYTFQELEEYDTKLYTGNWTSKDGTYSAKVEKKDGDFCIVVKDSEKEWEYTCKYDPEKGLYEEDAYSVSFSLDQDANLIWCDEKEEKASNVIFIKRT